MHNISHFKHWGGKSMYEEEFRNRLKELRKSKGIKAIDMSFDIGQNGSYISSIESGRNFPTMQGFFYICEYLNVTPNEFFSFNINNPIKFSHLIKNLYKLKPEEIESLSTIIDSMSK